VVANQILMKNNHFWFRNGPFLFKIRRFWIKTLKFANDSHFSSFKTRKGVFSKSETTTSLSANDNPHRNYSRLGRRLSQWVKIFQSAFIVSLKFISNWKTQLSSWPLNDRLDRPWTKDTVQWALSCLSLDSINPRINIGLYLVYIFTR